MASILTADLCPAVQVLSGSVLRNTGMDTAALVAPNVPATVTFRKQVNILGTITDQIARDGAGIIGVPDGPNKITLGVGSGLSLAVSAGRAMIGGPVEIPAATTLAVPDNTARVWIWLKQTGAALTYTSTTTPPAGEVCLLGSCTTAGGAITSIDTSGVMYLRGGMGWRQTADIAAPVDTPPATVVFLAYTLSGTYWWDGYSYSRITGDASSVATSILNSISEQTERVDGLELALDAFLRGFTGGEGYYDVHQDFDAVFAFAADFSGRLDALAASISAGLTAITANNQTGTSYSLVLTDAGKVIEMNNGSASTLTVTRSGAVAWPVGTVVEVFQQGAGQVTITADTGVTLRSDGAKVKTTAQYATASLRYRGSDEWVLSGDLST